MARTRDAGRRASWDDDLSISRPHRARPRPPESGVLALQRKAGNAAVGRILQRKIPPGDLAKKSWTEIMADEDYFDGPSLKAATFWDAERVDPPYTDGKNLKVGLLPETLTPPAPPIEGVDYKTTKYS